MAEKSTVASNSEVLDALADCVARIVREPERHAELIAIDYFWAYQRIRVGFDYFLVRMDDELAYQAGSPQSRWVERVTRMAHLARTGELPPVKVEPAVQGKRCVLCVCDSVAEKYGFPVCGYHATHGEDEPGCECGRDR